MVAQFHRLDRARLRALPSKFQSEAAKWPFWQLEGSSREFFEFNPLSGLLSHLAEHTLCCDMLLKEVHVGGGFQYKNFFLMASFQEAEGAD